MRRVRRGACGALAFVSGFALTAAVSITAPAGAADAAPLCPPASYGVHRHAPGTGKTVALTFDDGPGDSTGQIMKILAAAHVEATFFNIGGLEVARTWLVRSEYAAGFALGDHTWQHRELILLDASGQAYQIDHARAEQAKITGSATCLLRPPYGEYDATTLELAQERGMTVWNWSVDTEDWKAAGSADPYWVNRIVSRANAGGVLRHPVILLHNPPGGNPATVAALPAIIRYYKSHGYRFVDLYGHTGRPVVDRVWPESGRTAGGGQVTIRGHDLVGVQAVRFGGVDARSIDVESDTRLTVRSPAHAVGVVNVRVITTFGKSPLSTAARFRYVAPPTVASVQPSSGPAKGGTRIAVNGADFRHVLAVRFGTVAGTDIWVESTGRLHVTAPAHAVGVVNIRVVTDYGTSRIAAGDRFAYVAPP
jgi:peptidoglycan/xylan/chitin deacetylase (PgdA/CDA1 family)